MACSCDYSYTCPECQAKMDAENALDYARELQEYVSECLKLIADKLGIELPPPPKPRGGGNGGYY